MKKYMLLFLATLMLIPCFAWADEDNAWQVAPIITKTYELSAGKLYLEWNGNAPVYQVYMDGKSVASVIVNNAVISVEKGTHTLLVYPINEAKNADTKVELGFDVIGASIGLDLSALGLNSHNLTAGTPSAPLNIDYYSNSLFEAVPENLAATTDGKDRVLLSFTDRYHADEYIVSIKIGNDINRAKFSRGTADALIQQDKTTVTLTLDPEFLESQKCIAPELDEKYTFTVQLRKYAENMVDGEKIVSAVHTSKESSAYSYMPIAAWKTAPAITYASQTADGQITLQWEHDDYGRGCEYAIMKINKTLGIKTGEEKLGIAQEKSFTINDLMNGNHVFSIVPMLGDETGGASSEVSASIQNNWVVAPALTCEVLDGQRVRLGWTAAEGVEKYHVTVHKGDSESLLRFIDLDYSKYAEYDFASKAGEMEYVFTYGEEIANEAGTKFKFEIFGLRYTANGEEQKTATSVQTVTLQADMQ